MKKSDVFFIVGWLLMVAGAAGTILFVQQDLSVPTSQLVYSPVFFWYFLSDCACGSRFNYGCYCQEFDRAWRVR